jgi:hypothetical protein
VADESSAPEAAPAPEESKSTEQLAQENAELTSEIERLRAENSVATKLKRRRIRRFFVGFLVVLASISVLATTVSYWVHQTVFDTDKFVALVAPVIADRQVTDVMGTYLTQQTFGALDVQHRVETGLEALAGLLPPGIPGADQIKGLAAPIVAATQTAVRQRVNSFLHSPRFQSLWNDLLRRAHTKAIALVRGDLSQTPNLQISGETVYLNTIPIIAQVLRSLVEGGLGLVGLNVTIPQISPAELPQEAIAKLSSVLGVTLPQNFGQIPVMSTDKLHQVQQAATTFDRLIWALFLLAIVLIVLAIVLSLNRRRTLLQLGIGVTAAFLVAGAAIRIIKNKVVDAITDPSARNAARDVIGTVLNDLRTTGLVVLILAIVLGVAAYLWGRPGWLMALIGRVRRATAEGPDGSEVERLADRRFDWLAVGGAAVAVALLILVGVGLWSVVVLGALLGLWLWGLVALRNRARARRASGPDMPSDVGQTTGTQA